MKGMAMRRLAILSVMGALSCALSACGDGGGDRVIADNVQAPETGATAAVSKLDEGLRNGVFEKAIRASGAACPSVTGSQRANATMAARI
jgi:hypothetical protein